MNFNTIGFDAKRIVGNATGLGNYGCTLVNDLAPLLSPASLRLYAPTPGRDELRGRITEAPNVCFVYPKGSPSRIARDIWRSRNVVRDLVADGVDIYHGLTGELPMGLKKSGVKGVVTIHDLIFMRHPEYYNPIDVLIYKWKFRLTCREASHIIAISERTKADIVELGGVNPDMITVVYQSSAPRFAAPSSADDIAATRRKYRLPQRFVLNVGTIEERKNVLLACRALHDLPQDVGLVVVGRRTKYADKVEAYCREHGLEGRVLMLSGVSDADLACIYHAAEVFVYPSRYEGFGIPIIEAIQSGLPVVAATGSCLEEAGGPDSLYVDPDNAHEAAAAIGQMLSGAEFREQRIALSREYVRRFENGDVAKQVAEVYRRL